MNIINTPQLVVLSALSCVATPTLALAQSDDPIVVTADRLPESLSTVSGNVDLLTAEEIDTRQQDRLQDALNLTPGVFSTSTAGQEGQTGTLIIRGLPTRYNQLSIDGVRVSHSINGGNYGNILGAFQFGGGDQLEAVVGAKGFVHGNSAIGGVVGIAHAFENSGTSYYQEFGSDSFLNSQFSHAESVGDFDYYLNAGYNEQDGDGITNDFENRQLSLGGCYHINEASKLAFTFRRGKIDLLTGGAFGGLNETDYDVLSLKYNYEGDYYQSSTILSYFKQEYAFGSSFSNEYDKISLTSDHRWQVSDTYKVGAGLDATLGDFNQESSFTGVTDVEEDAVGFYLNAEADFGQLSFSAGVRGEENSLFGFNTSVDLGSRLLLEASGTEVSINVGRGVRTPTFTDSGAFQANGRTQLANPDLDEEIVNSLELGMTQDIGNAQLSITGYAHFLEDAIQTSFDPVTFTSITTNAPGTAEVFGFDLGLSGSLTENLHYKLAWNYALKNDVAPDFPRNTVVADLYYGSEDWAVGLWASNRSSFNVPGGSNELDAHLITRIYGHYQITDNVRLTARVENLLDESYENNPFDATQRGRGTSFYAGVKSTW